jgi:heme-degrading monooxygenase HmoA
MGRPRGNEDRRTSRDKSAARPQSPFQPALGSAKNRPMFIAVNRFSVKPEKVAEFEAIWLARETYWQGVPGFVRFRLTRKEGAPPTYLSETTWQSKAAFEGWIGSDSFIKSHQGAHAFADLYAAPTVLETFEALREEEAR